MNTLRVAGFVLVACAAAAQAGAQVLRGFAGGGVVSDLNSGEYPSFAGGLIVTPGQPWISAGAEGELIVAWPYFAGRGTWFGQGNLLHDGAVRPFLLGGVGFGELTGAMAGGGVELHPRGGPVNVRLTIEDYLVRVPGFDYGTRHGGRPYTGHQLSVRVALLFH